MKRALLYYCLGAGCFCGTVAMMMRLRGPVSGAVVSPMQYPPGLPSPLPSFSLGPFPKDPDVPGPQAPDSPKPPRAAGRGNQPEAENTPPESSPTPPPRAPKRSTTAAPTYTYADQHAPANANATNPLLYVALGVLMTAVVILLISRRRRG
jgi:hypothetical protein